MAHTIATPGKDKDPPKHKKPVVFGRAIPIKPFKHIGLHENVKANQQQKYQQPF